MAALSRIFNRKANNQRGSQSPGEEATPSRAFRNFEEWKCNYELLGRNKFPVLTANIAADVEFSVLHQKMRKGDVFEKQHIPGIRPKFQ